MLDLKALLAKILDALKSDYVVEQGTDGIWTYRKWNSGSYEAVYVGLVNMKTGSAMGGGYFHQTTSALSPPSFSQTVKSLHGSANGALLFSYVGYANNYSTYWWNASSGAVNNVPVRLEMHGTWGGVIESIKRFFTSLSSPKDWGWAYC